MGRYMVRRLGRMLITLALATFIFFAAVTVLPGDPVRALFGFRPPPPDVYARIQGQFHLDEPFLTQYVLYMSDLLRGDLGYSFPLTNFGNSVVGPPVSGTLRATLPVTLRLLGAALVVQVVVGMGLGVLSALRRRALTGVAVYAVAVLLVSTPVIVAAYGLQAFAGYEIAWLPYDWVNGAGWRNYLLPVAALSAGFAAYTLLLARAELVATLRRPFIHAAIAKGMSSSRVVGVHALRASMVPVVAYVTANLGTLLAALVVVEGIYEMPGLGGALFVALRQQDRALIVVVILLILSAVIVVNALADIAYSVIDPRIRLGDD